MRFALTKEHHSAIDYVLAALLVLCSLVFFDQSLRTRNLFLIVGISLALLNLFSDRAHSVFKLIPFSLHRAIDATAAFFLIGSPVVMNTRILISGWEVLLHYGFGAALLFLAVFTRSSAVHLREEADHRGTPPHRVRDDLSPPQDPAA